jgi:hypothetical protein
MIKQNKRIPLSGGFSYLTVGVSSHIWQFVREHVNTTITNLNIRFIAFILNDMLLVYISFICYAIVHLS